MALADEQASLYHLHLEFDKPSSCRTPRPARSTTVFAN